MTPAVVVVVVVVVGVVVEVVVEVVAVVIVEVVIDVMAVVTIVSSSGQLQGHQAVVSNSKHVASSIVMQQWP